MTKKFLLSLSICAVAANAQHALSLDGFAEICAMKSCNNQDFNKNIYAIGALSFTLNKGWTTTIEGEFDQKEFALTQLFVAKEFSEYANLKAGQITVPIGHYVPYNRPENHLTVLLPESESIMMPYHWDQLGISFFGERKQWAYNAMMLVDKGGIAGAMRIDCMRLKGLRVGVSAYFGKTFLYQFSNDSLRYDNLGNLTVAGIDFDYSNLRLVTHGYATFSHSKGGFAHNALCAGAELGCNILSQSHKLIPFVRYDFYNTSISETNLSVIKTDNHRFSIGISYSPLKHLFIKAEYAHHRHNSSAENHLLLGIAVSGATNLLKSLSP